MGMAPKDGQHDSEYEIKCRSKRLVAMFDPMTTVSQENSSSNDLPAEPSPERIPVRGGNMQHYLSSDPNNENETLFYIWYQRGDRNLPWKDVFPDVRNRFPGSRKEKASTLQAAFYEFIREQGCPLVRKKVGSRFNTKDLERARSMNIQERCTCLGVVGWTGLWFPWMKEDQSTVMEKHNHAQKVLSNFGLMKQKGMRSKKRRPARVKLGVRRKRMLQANGAQDATGRTRRRRNEKREA